MKSPVSISLLALCVILPCTTYALELVETSQESSRTQDLITYFESERALAQGNPLKALKKLAKSSQNTDKSRKHARIRALLQAEQFEELAQEINDFLLSDLEMQLAFLQAYTSTNQLQKAETLLETLLKESPSNEQVLYAAANFYTQTQKIDKALSSIDHALQKNTSNHKKSIFLFLKSKIYAAAARYKEALEAINTVLETTPQFDKAYLLKAALLTQAGNKKDAISTYKKYLELAGDDQEVTKQLIQLLFAEKQFDEALTYLQKNPEESAEYFFDCSLLALNAKKKEEAYSYIEKALAKNPHFKKAIALKLSMMLSDDKHDEALASIQNALNQNPGDLFILKLLPELLKSNVHPRTIVTMLEEVSTIHKNEKNLIAARTDLYISLKDFDKALTCCDQLIKLTHDDLLTSKALFQKAYINMAQNNYEPVEDLLLSALKTKKVFTPAYNFLALYYATQTPKLNLARKYIEIALQKEPKNATFRKTKQYIEEQEHNGLQKKA